MVKKMQKEKVMIYLGFTSNITTSGLRDIITYLVRNKLVHFLVTTTGGLEEDVIKTHGDFLHGDFEADGEYLRARGSTGPETYSYPTRGTSGTMST